MQRLPRWPGQGQPATAPSAGRCHGPLRERDGAAPAARHPRNPALSVRRVAAASPDLPVRVSGRSSIPRARPPGLRLAALDGWVPMLRGEARNREESGLPGAWRRAPAFPQARVTAVMEIGTRAGPARHAGPCAESGMAQAEKLPGHPSSGMPVPADRHHAGAPPWSRAVATGAGLLRRCKGNMRLPAGEAFDDGSWPSVLIGSGPGRRKSRGELAVRIIACRISDGGEIIMPATTLMDHHFAPAAGRPGPPMTRPGPACRARRRLALQTPALARQEAGGLMLAHHAVRCLVHEAAGKSGEDADRSSFVHSVHVMRP